MVSATWLNFGNSNTIETTIRSTGTQTWGALSYNNYSKGTTAAGPNVPFKFIGRFSSPYWSLTAHVPSGATPDPTPDGLMAVIQPNGSVLTTFSTIVMANGDLFTGSASFIDASVTMVGSGMGTRASLIPPHAGIVMQGEISSGKINHVLALVIGPSGALLANPVYPAYALDSSPTYTGTSGHAVPMGTILAIPTTVNLGSAGLSTSTGLILARTMQEYGGVYVDTAGASVFGIVSQTGATDIPAYSGPLAADIGIIMNLCKIVSSPVLTAPSILL